MTAFTQTHSTQHQFSSTEWRMMKCADLVGSWGHAAEQTNRLEADVSNKPWTLRLWTHHFHSHAQLIEQLPTNFTKKTIHRKYIPLTL